MEQQQLKQTLGELHEELSSGAKLSPDIRQLLQQLATDIDSILESSAEQETTGEAAAERPSVLDSLLNLTSEFEESHPKLAATLGKMADALSRMGI